jgi:hypothetical protein
MSHDYDVVLARKDGSVRHFRIYGQPRPKGGVISLPVEGRAIKAEISEPSPGSEISKPADQTSAVEV